jgi:hypothetical protein
MVKSRPELFYAFVGTCQVADHTRNYVVADAALLEKATREGNGRTLQELNEVGPPPYKDGKGFAVQRKWSNLFDLPVAANSSPGTAPNAPARRRRRYDFRDRTAWWHNLCGE